MKKFHFPFLAHFPLILAATFTLPSSTLASGSEQVGIIAQSEGKVELFKPTTDQPAKDGDGVPFVKFDGKLYRYFGEAKIGDRVENGSLLRTRPGAKARVLFDNGDHYSVGSATAYRVSWNGKAKGSQVDLMYGKLRGVVDKGGPRNRLTIRTKAATMGVRGTDFFIYDGGKDKGTEVVVLRGAVQVKPVAASANGEAPKPIEVKSGYSAAVAPTKTEEAKDVKAPASTASTPAPAAATELRKTSQEELAGIQMVSSIQQMRKEDLQSPSEKETAAKIETLEKKAAQVILKDIQHEDPTLYAQLKDQPVSSPDELNRATVQKLLKDAPSVPERRKPFQSEIDELEGAAYEKYFKLGQ